MYFIYGSKAEGAGAPPTSRESRGLYISSRNPPTSTTRQLAIDVKSRTSVATLALLTIAHQSLVFVPLAHALVYNMTVSSKMNSVSRQSVFSRLGPGGLLYAANKIIAVCHRIVWCLIFYERKIVFQCRYVCKYGVFNCVFHCSQVAAGKDEERWRSKNEGALFKRWKRTTSSVESSTPVPTPTTPSSQPSDLLKFLAIVSIPHINLK